jgi:hypothetical protein
VIELNQILDSKNIIKIKEDLLAIDDGTLGRIHYVFKSAPTPIAVLMNQKREENVSLHSNKSN